MPFNRRILIADDERDLRECLVQLLLGTGRRNEMAQLVEKMRSRLSGKTSLSSSGQDSSIENEEPYEIYTAANGQDAAQMVKDAVDTGKPFAAVFLDIRMPPGPDGLETARKIHEIDPKVEVVIMTAYADHDQKTLSDSLQRPEKLLYIKKPFHADEISQTACCLIAKWNAEAVENKRKSWLESIIKSMSKLNMSAAHGQSVYMTLLKAIQAFTDSESAFVAVWDGRRWDIKQTIGISEEDSVLFVSENSKALLACRSTQSIGDKYVLPINRESFSAAVILSGITAQNDPEWYKLLMLLGMTAGDALAQQQPVHDTTAAAALDKIKSCAESIKNSSENKPEAAMAEEIIKAVVIVAKVLSLKGA